MGWVCEKCGYSGPDESLFCGECGSGRHDHEPVSTTPSDHEVGYLDTIVEDRREAGTDSDVSDLFETPFDADAGESPTIGLEPEVRWGRWLVLLVLLGAAFAGGYYFDELWHSIAGSRAEPASSSASNTQDSSALEGTGAEVALDAGEVEAPVVELAAAPIEADVAPDASVEGDPPIEPVAVACVPDVERAAATLPKGLLPTMAGASVGFALDRALYAATLEATTSTMHQAAIDAASPPPEPLPEQTFALVEAARQTGLAATYLRMGELEEASQQIDSAQVLAGRSDESEPSRLAVDIERAITLNAEVRAAYSDLRCSQARALATDLSVLSPPLGRRYRRRFDDCVARWEEAQGLPPRTLE